MAEQVKLCARICYAIDGQSDLLVVLLDAPTVVRQLVWQEGVAILSELKCEEIEIVPVKLVAHMRMKEVIDKTVQVQYRSATSQIVVGLDKRGNRPAFIIGL